MFSSISSINAIATKAKKLVPTPNTYFTFNTLQTSGTTVTSVVGSSTITLSNTSAISNLAPKEGTDSFFGGNKLYFGRSSNISLPATNGISMSLWFKSSVSVAINVSPNGAKEMVCIGPGTGATGSDILRVYIVDLASWYIQIITKTTAINFPTALNVLDEQWHHLVLTWTGTSIKGYIDNVLKLNSSSALLLNTANTYNSLAVNARTDNTAHPTNTGFFSIDCLRLYNKVLSTTEINAIYNAGT